MNEELALSKELESAIYEQLLIYKSKVPTETLYEFSAIPSNDLVRCHFGLGLYIRNKYLYAKGDLYKCFIANDITHEDYMSSIIISVWHRILNEELNTYNVTV